jgi:glycosyltransferase involved in cell wall biosynthesis
MHIGLDARFLGESNSGLAQYSENLIQSLARLDSRNRYTVFVNSRLTRRPKVGDNFSLVRVRGTPASVRGMARLRLAMRRRDPVDLMHVHFPLAPWDRRPPVLITVHDVVPFSRASGGDRRVQFWDRIGGWFLYPMTMSRAKWILCVSHATRDRLVSFFPEALHKTIVMASGVEDLYRKRTEKPTAELIRSRFQTPERYILYSGSTGSAKNLPMMVEAFGRLLRRAPAAAGFEFALDLTGDLSGLDAIHAAIERARLRDRVRILTEVSPEERHVLFEEARLLFIASKEEGFGFPALKAQLSGVPVVAADAGALPEVCGEAALLVDPDDPDQMAEMLTQALFNEELRAYLIEKGRKNAARFSWDSTAKGVLQVYELLF